MKTELDFEKIQHILEKVEQGEPLDISERAYLGIIKALKAKKNEHIEIPTAFQNTLKNTLLAKYDELYGKKWWYHSILSIMQTPFLKLTVSFCFILSLTLWIYSSLYLEHTGTRYPGSVNSSLEYTDSVSMPESSGLLGRMKSIEKRWWGINFWGSAVQQNIVWSSNSGSDWYEMIIIMKNIILYGVIVSIIIALIIFFRRKKK